MIVPIVFEIFILPLHVKCKCGTITYFGNHEQPFCLIKINGCEIMFFLN